MQEKYVKGKLSLLPDMDLARRVRGGSCYISLLLQSFCFLLKEVGKGARLYSLGNVSRGLASRILHLLCTTIRKFICVITDENPFTRHKGPHLFVSHTH